MSTTTVYVTGTATFTNGSNAVVGVSTLATTLLKGDPILAPDGKFYEIDVITDDTHWTLDRVYAGTTAAASPAGTGWFALRSSISRDSSRSASKQLADIALLYRSILNLTSVDQLVKLNRATTADRAGTTVQVAGVDKFRTGSFANANYAIQWLNGATWTDSITIDPTTGAVTIPSLPPPDYTVPMRFTNATEATGLGTTAGGIFSGGVEILKKLFVTGAVSLASTLAVASDFSINTNKFTVTAASGNTAVAGTLTTTGLATANGGLTVSGSALTLSGNITKAGWTTNGVQFIGAAATFTDNSTAAGTVATAYSSVSGGNTIATAVNAVTFTNYFEDYFKAPVAGAHVTLANAWALGADNLYVGTSNPFTVSSAGAVSVGGRLTVALASGHAIGAASPGLGWGLYHAGTINATGGFAINWQTDAVLTATANGDALQAMRITANPAKGAFTGVVSTGLYIAGAGSTFDWGIRVNDASPVYFGGTLAVSGASTLSGTLAVTGAATFGTTGTFGTSTVSGGTIANGPNSGTGAGSQFVSQLNGVSNLGFGNYSKIISGGTYDARPVLYANGSLMFYIGGDNALNMNTLNTASTSTTTGTLVVSGGLGVGGAIYAGGLIRGSLGAIFGQNATGGVNTSVSLASGDGAGVGCIFYFLKNSRIAAGQGFWIFGHKSGVLGSGTSDSFQIYQNGSGAALELDAATNNLIAGTNIVLSPQASATPASNGQLTFQATSNTSLTFKYKGSDGTVRSASLTLT